VNIHLISAIAINVALWAAIVAIALHTIALIWG
jgi:hypothetical protein